MWMDGRMAGRAKYCNNVGGVMVLILSTLFDNVLYLYQVLSKYLIRFQSYGPEQKGRRQGGH